MERDTLQKFKRNGTFYRQRKRNAQKWINLFQNGNNQSATEPNQSNSAKSVHSDDCDLDHIIEFDNYGDDHDNLLLEDDDSDDYSDDTDLVNEIFEDNGSIDDRNEMSSERELQYWAINFNISQHALKYLLTILRRKFNANLPSDPRTLLKTPCKSNQQIQEISGGQYWHYGLGVCLQNYFSNVKIPEIISININIDGVPLYRSSKTQFWPILFNITEIPDVQPMPIAIFCGNSKPGSIEEFLRPLVKELTEILNNGIIINGQKLIVKLRCFICDSPARAFIKGVINFNGINGCLKCTAEGESIQHTVVFTSVNSSPRLDKKFRAKAYGKHHKNPTPLLDIPNFDIIEDVIVADSLHLLHLGVMKRLLAGWRDGSLGFFAKLSAIQINHLDQKISRVKLPSEIHRSMRQLDCLAHWKGVEFGNFLNYVSIVVLQGTLPEEAYNHFLLFFCAVTIVSSNVYRHFLSISEEMFKLFIVRFIAFYGAKYATSNIHNLQHIVKEVIRFGPLNTFSAYPFENRLYQIKNMLRGSQKNLEQIANRLAEISNCNYYKDEMKKKKIPEIKKWKHKKVDHVQISISDGFLLRNTFKDSWFFTKNKEIVRFCGIRENQNELKIQGRSVIHRADFFTEPFMSSYLNIFTANSEHLSNVKEYTIDDVSFKFITIQKETHFTVFIPLLHTL